MTKAASLPHIGVIADDLQGALAAGVRLRDAGLRTVVVSGAEWPQTPEAIVVNVGTRALVTSGARTIHGPARLVETAARRLAELRCARLELRVDALLRRDYFEEVDAMLTGARIDSPLILAVPAYPSAGRSTRDGRQRARVMHRRDQLTDAASRLFGTVTSHSIPLAEVARGPGAIVENIEHVLPHCRRFLAEATSEEHLRNLALAAADLELRHTIVSISSGAWLRFHPAQPATTPFVLVAMGHPTEPNESQLLALLEAERTKILLPSEAIRLSVEPAELVDRMRSTDVVVVKAEGETPDERARLHGAEDVAKAVDALLATCHRNALRCQGVIATGAYTASRVAHALRAELINPITEADPLCPIGILGGGPWAGLPIVVKGGYVGDRETLVNLARNLGRVDRVDDRRVSAG